jgi:hypothetical protein
MAYRISRNIEASIIDYITAQLVVDAWTGIYVEKVFTEIYAGHYPAILINMPERPERRREIGSDSLMNNANVEIRIFAENDGQRLDLSDWILPKLISGINYYTYIIAANGTVSSKTLAGKINILNITANRKENINVENLSNEDRYRHLISLSCRVGLS